jgi:TolA-binding protein
MQGSRVRRLSSWPILSLLLLSLLLAVSSGCKVPSSHPSAAGSSSSSSSESESERTRKIKEKADEIDRKAAEIQNMQGTEQEKIDAVNALDKERRELTEMQEQGKQ